jgi:hypothetical protein
MFGRKSPSLRLAVLLAGLLSTFCLSGFAQSRMTVRREVQRDVSPPLREMIKLMPPRSLVRREAEPVRRIPLPPGLSTQGQGQAEDAVRQQSVVPFTPVVGTSFEGLGAGQYGFTVNSAPPDTNGAVGATQYVQWVNESFAVFNKNTGKYAVGRLRRRMPDQQ